MKKIFLLLIILSAKFSFAQQMNPVSYSGIYITAQDYADNKLSYAINIDSAGGNIKVNCCFSQQYIEVTSAGKKIKLNKDSIYGYRDNKQQDFRLFKNDDRAYRIMENREIVIYIADVRENSSTGKTFTMVPAYFFSKTVSSEILPLTVINLKRASPGNLKFHDLLDVEFPNDNNISIFDSIHNMYRVNYLLSQSLTN